MEAYIAKAKLEEQMKVAKDSHVVNAGGMAVVISDLLSEVHNAPEDEDDSFEMIDLDTGLPLDNSNLDTVLPLDNSNLKLLPTFPSSVFPSFFKPF